MYDTHKRYTEILETGENFKCSLLGHYLTRLAAWPDCVSLPQGADPSPLPLRVAKAGRNHLNKESTLPSGIGEG